MSFTQADVVEAIDALLAGTAGHRERTLISALREMAEVVSEACDSEAAVEALDILLLGNRPLDFVDREIVMSFRRRFESPKTNVRFDRIRTPRFEKEAAEAFSKLPDIRQELAANVRKDIVDEMNSRINRMLIGRWAQTAEGC